MSSQAPITVLSSMATKQLVMAMAKAYEGASGHRVVCIAIGGVDAAKRVRAGEVFDVVVLAKNVIVALLAEAHLGAGTRVDVVHSDVALAVKEGEPQPDIGSDEHLKAAFLTSKSIGFSTGPSGAHLLDVLARWGIADALAPRLVRAPPGVPVGELITSGQAALGFQQLSELMFHPGVQLLGPLAPSIQLRTTFSAAIGRKSDKAQSAHAFLQFCTSPGVAALKSSQGMIAP